MFLIIFIDENKFGNKNLYVNKIYGLKKLKKI